MPSTDGVALWRIRLNILSSILTTVEVRYRGDIGNNYRVGQKFTHMHTHNHSLRFCFYILCDRDRQAMAKTSSAKSVLSSLKSLDSRQVPVLLRQVPVLLRQVASHCSHNCKTKSVWKTKHFQ